MSNALKPVGNSAPNDAASKGAKDQWVAHGRELAKLEGPGAFKSIDSIHSVECFAFATKIAHLKATGRHLVEQVQTIDLRLQGLDFNLLVHLSEVAQGKVDLCWAVGLTFLNAVLAAWAVSMSGASLAMVPLLALLALATAASVEEFFAANHEKNALKTGIFLALSLLTLGASYWQGSLRGLFLMALNEDQSGPAGQALFTAGAVLRHTLASFTVVSEVLAGWKWFEARRRLLSSTARSYRHRQARMEEITELHATIAAAEVEPKVRDEYRRIGARQYLAQAAKPADLEYLRKAAIGAVIALIVLFGLLFLARAADAAPALKQTAVGFDASRSSSVEEMAENAQAVERLLLTVPDQTRFLVLGISNGFGTLRPLLDVTFQGLGSGLQLQAAKERAVAQWRRTAASLKPEYNHTAIVDTIEQLSFITGGRNLDLYLLTDGREDTAIDIEHMPIVDVPKSMKRLTEKGLIPSLTGTRVHMLGVGVRGKTSSYVSSLRDFWRTFFLASGATLETFRIDRTISDVRQR